MEEALNNYYNQNSGTSNQTIQSSHDGFGKVDWDNWDFNLDDWLDSNSTTEDHSQDIKFVDIDSNQNSENNNDITASDNTKTKVEEDPYIIDLDDWDSGLGNSEVEFIKVPEEEQLDTSNIDVKKSDETKLGAEWFEEW